MTIHDVASVHGDTPPKPRHAVRWDIEGLRAVAVVLVVLYHAGMPGLAAGFSGVDIFFVISGFLITGQLVGEMERRGTVRLAAFWGRRARRLLPASALVLWVSSVLVYLYLPLSERTTFAGDVKKAALYVVNWRLAGRSVDYLAEDVGPSPVQHFWSLAVEEQFYLVWPVIIVLVVLAARRRWLAGLSVTIAALVAASLVASVVLTRTHPSEAFFVSTTRFWELGAGALLALARRPLGRAPQHLLSGAGYAGVALLVVGLVTVGATTPWPSWRALLPVLASVLVLASGLSTTPGLLQRVLSLRPLTWVGGLSYSWYLWHWPLLVALEAQHPHVRIRWRLALVVLSVVPAWLSKHWIEDPVRSARLFARPAACLTLAAGLTVASVGVASLLSSSTAWSETFHEASASQALGARALLDPRLDHVTWSGVQHVKDVRPLPEDASTDYEHAGCQIESPRTAPKICTAGDPHGTRTVFLVGDSKAGQWQSAIEDVAAKQHWKVLISLKGHCPLVDATVVAGTDTLDDCRTWGRTMTALLLKDKPDLVIESHLYRMALPTDSSPVPKRSIQAMADGLARTWGSLESAGIPVVTLLDNPSPTASAPVFDCVQAHSHDLSACSFSKADGIGLSSASGQRLAAAAVPGVHVVDMTDVVCPDATRCPAIIGHVLVYRQGTHLTRTFVDSARSQLSTRLFQATDGLFGAAD